MVNLQARKLLATDKLDNAAKVRHVQLLDVQIPKGGELR
jgi:hypothetical protein